MSKTDKRRLTVAAWHEKVRADIKRILMNVRHYYPINSLVKSDTISWNAICYGEGPSGQYCVKVFNEITSGIKRTYRDLVYTANIMLSLQSLGFNHVLPPLLSRRGRYCHKCGGYWVTVFPRAKNLRESGNGKDQNQSSDRLKRVARVLRNMHALSGRFSKCIPYSSKRDIPHALKPSAWAACAESLWMRAEQSLRLRMSSNASIEKLYKARRLGEALISENQWFFEDNSVDEVLIHGDFGPENVSEDSGKRLIVLDFDTAHHSHREVDVVCAALNFSGPRWMIGSRNWPKFYEFLKAYEKGFVEDEKHRVRLGVALKWCLIKAISLSFKESQVDGRFKLYDEIISKRPLE